MTTLVFDEGHYARLNAARGEAAREVIADLRGELSLRTAIDVGCGIGYFANLLRSEGFDVTAVDGRAENIDEANRRFPSVAFHRSDIEDPRISEFGSFDLCFCFGLLYHLENPFLAVRHLRSLTKSVLLAEGMIYPGNEPTMALVDEAPFQDQGLRHFAFYPTEACMVKMFYRAGFPQVYELTSPPMHQYFHPATDGRRIRTMLAASLMPLASKRLRIVSEPSIHSRTLEPTDSERSETVQKLRRFAGKSISEKVETLKRVVKKSK